MLAPSSVIVPVPVLVSPPVPDITPEKVVLVSLPPVVSVAEPSVTLPAPASEPIALLKLLRASVAPALTETALLSPNALPEPACSTPASTAVAPV